MRVPGCLRGTLADMQTRRLADDHSRLRLRSRFAAIHASTERAFHRLRPFPRVHSRRRGALSDDQTQQVLQGAFRQGSRADPALRHLALLSAMEWRRRSGQSITDALPPGVLSRPDSGALSRAIAAHVKREERKDSQGEVTLGGL